MSEDQSIDITTMTAEIVSAYVSGNKIATTDLADLIQSVFKSLSTVGQSAAEPTPEASAKPTTGQIRKSVRPDGLVSFIDGRPYKTLKRHLSKHGLTVAEYKEKYGLPKDYPTTASDYSAKRSEMAKSLGLGRQAKAEVAAVAAPAPKTRKPRVAKAAA